MKGVNAYFRNLSAGEIKNKKHRDFVGGMWEELGLLQLNFLTQSGLKPNHKLLDVGCGSLRGGVHFVNYLGAVNYYGLDINESLIDAGKIELEEANLTDKKPNLIVDDEFSFDKFSSKFDFMISVSVFTHLPMNIIVRCLKKARESLAKDGCIMLRFLKPLTKHV